MKYNEAFTISSFDFNQDLYHELDALHYAKELWPLVYILNDGKIKEAYIGETTDTYVRMTSHLKSSAKNKLTAVHLITSEKFNKSATLDIESNLIKYLSGDGQYKLLNANLGLANHNFYQKREYWETFKAIWNQLRAKGITQHSIEYINNSDLFKYSPYKSLTIDQRNGLKIIMTGLLSENFKTIIIEGGAGSGKTILATFLFKLLMTSNDDFNFKEFGDDEEEFIELVFKLKSKYVNPKIALVVPMSSFRKTLQNVFINIKGLRSNMVIGPSQVASENYDIIIVDESHRLRQRINLGTYFGAFDNVNKKLQLNKTSNELDWVVKQSKKTILFYDENQSIKPSDVNKVDFDKLKNLKTTKVDHLKSQFRVKGGNDYVDYLNKLMSSGFNKSDALFNSKKYEFLLFESIEELVKEIKSRNDEHGLARMVAGFSWEWISQNKPTLRDIQIDGVGLRWNSKSVDWVNSANAINEVGCIHTIQGYDLNYTGVIFGHEITYDFDKDEIVILKDNYYDKNGKQSISEINDLKAYIINIYKTIMLRGIKGTYVYVCDNKLRAYFAEHIPMFGNESLSTTRYLPFSEVIPYINSIPVYGLRAAAGQFSRIQKVQDCNWIKLPPRYKPSKELFGCIVDGESMNKIIPNGSVCLFRKYTAGSRNGMIVLVEYTDFRDSEFGSCYTVKEYHSTKNYENDSWIHQSITLKPLSQDSNYKEIVVQEDALNELKVIGIFECVLT